MPNEYDYRQGIQHFVLKLKLISLAEHMEFAEFLV